MTSVPLGEVASFINGFPFKPSDWQDEGHPIIRIQNLTDEAKPYNRTTRVVPSRYLVRTGDLLVSWSATLGVFTWNRPEVGLVNQHIFRVTPEESKVTKGYLRHMLVGALIDMEQHLHGATMKHVNREEFLATHIPLPSLREQGRVTAILNQTDALRARRLHARTHLEALWRSAYQSTFGSPGKAWPVLSIGEVTVCLDARRKPVKESERPIGEVPYYGANGRQGWIDRPLFDESLVLVAEDGGHFGTPERGVAYRIDGPAWVNNHAHVLRPGPHLDVEYLHRTLRHFDFRPYISGTTRSKLTQEQLNSARIMVPPLELQKAFARKSVAISALGVLLDRASATGDELTKSLGTSAFRGAL